MLSYVRNHWFNTYYGIVWETKYGRFTTLNIAECEHFTLLVCPVQFLVISAMRRLGNVQSSTLMIIWEPCSKTCSGSGVQKRVQVHVGLLPINSITCDSVCLRSKLETRACNIHDCSGLRIEDLSVGSHIWITYQQSFFFLERFSFQFSTVHLVVLEKVLPTLSRWNWKASGVT